MARQAVLDHHEWPDYTPSDSAVENADAGGIEAFEAGSAVCENPHTHSVLREAWTNGWFRAKESNNSW